MRHQAQKYPDRLALIAQAARQDSQELDRTKLALSVADQVEELINDLGLSKRLSDYGIKKEDLPSIARDASGSEEYSIALKVLEAIF
jgi:alcohol dehydrogenase class IV